MLTDLKARQATPAERDFKLYDKLGLFLLVRSTGSKLWRMRYQIGGKAKSLALGSYPTVGLAAARAARDQARAELLNGRDPSLTRQLLRASAVADDRRFETVARAWHKQAQAAWGSPRHRQDVIESLERHVFPVLGGLPIDTISAPMVLNVLRSVERAGAIETAHRVRQRVEKVFGHAIASGLAVINPASMVAAAMTPVVRGRQPAIVELEDVREMLRAAEGIPAHPVTRLAHRMLALTAVRTSVVHGAAWGEFEGLEGAAPVWRIPAGRMKGTLLTKADHVVPLSAQAVEIVHAVRRLTGSGPLLFPNARWAHRPMSENAIGYLLNRAGYDGRHVPHGWRATFSTVMNERLPADRAVIDLMLAHLPKDRTEAAYNRAQHGKRRREIAQQWADLLLEGFPPASTLLEGRAR